MTHHHRTEMKHRTRIKPYPLSPRFRQMPPDDYWLMVRTLGRINRLVLLHPAATLGSIKRKAATLARIIDRME